MTTDEAVQNLDNLISSSRMTRPEHIGMSQSLEHLKIRALLLDAQEQKAKEIAEEAIEPPKAPEPEVKIEEKDNAEPIE